MTHNNSKHVGMTIYVCSIVKMPILVVTPLYIVLYTKKKFQFCVHSFGFVYKL